MDVQRCAHLRWVQLRGRPVNVLDIGEGPAAVFLHGLSGHGATWSSLEPPERFNARRARFIEA